MGRVGKGIEKILSQGKNLIAQYEEEDSLEQLKKQILC